VDKIDIAGRAAPFFNPAANIAARTETKKARDKGGVKKSAFSRLLEQQELRETEAALPDELLSGEALQELLDDVHSAGDALRLRPLEGEIKQYKRAVRNFLRYVVENGYATKQVQTIERKKKGIIPYVQIEVVDRKLEQLAAGILSGQIGQVAILARLDEITGLLVDLMQ
jgi:uncharacterized protein YaaR (DUF327 family)